MRALIARRRTIAQAILVPILLLAVSTVTTPAAAQAGLSITTPFPAVSFQPGTDVAFELTVRAAESARVDLSVEGLPEGWTASLSGGGNEVHSVLTEPAAPAAVTLNVQVPEAPAPTRTTLAVVGRAGAETARLELDLIPAEAAGGAVALESDYPSLRGDTEQDFKFNLTLRNDTPQQLVFGLQASGPGGWEVVVQPSGQARAASVTVDARSTQRLELTATPAPRTAAGSYPIAVEAIAGEHRATAELAVEVTGSVVMRLTAPEERLNTTANAGGTRDFQVLVVNEGTAALSDVTLSGRGPSEWEIVFEPEAIEQLAPGDTASATARITPSGNAVAGDYVVTLSGRTEGADESVEVRVTVETPPVWGIVGVALIVATMGGMVLIFRRYGRR